jgi:uncharacterized protein (TIGR00369 family)
MSGEIVPEGFVPADLGPGFGAGFGPVYVDRSTHRMGFWVKPQHGNPVGTCHGGALATFCDTLLMAHWAGREEGLSHSPTISLSVDYLAPAPVGTWVEAEVRLDRKTSTMVFVGAVLTVEGKPIARIHSIYRHMRGKEQTND